MRQLSNRDKKTFFLLMQGIVVKGARNCGYVQMEELRFTASSSEPALFFIRKL